MAQTLTLSEFKVDLQDLEDAIGAVKVQAEQIYAQTNEIKNILTMPDSPAIWGAPAAGSFNELQSACVTAMDTLNSLLAEMINRMHTAYENYHQAELDNFQNLNHQGG